MTSTAISQIIWPRAALADCLFCTILRDTRGVALDQDQRFNFFPASPFCSVTWMFEGELYAIDRVDQMERPWTGTKVPNPAFASPLPKPSVTWNSGEAFMIVVGFYPDAFSAMTGVDLGQFTGRPITEEILPLSIFEPCRDFLDAVPREGTEKSLSALYDQIEIVWTSKRPAGSGPTRRLKDWSRSLAARAAFSGSGRSTRQIARRIKSWTGVSERDLRGIGHAEHLYAKLLEAIQTGGVDWAELAAAAGFADQAHMIRQMRRSSGFTPEQLRQRAGSDEAFWGYRLLSQYFAKVQKQ
jgi:AraC-like DNA-binding protein